MEETKPKNILTIALIIIFTTLLIGFGIYYFYPKIKRFIQKPEPKVEIEIPLFLEEEERVPLRSRLRPDFIPQEEELAPKGLFE